MTINPLRLKLAEMLRHELVRTRVRQNAVADQLGVSPSAVSQLLQGKITPSMVQLNAICELLGLSKHASFELRCLLSKIRCGATSEVSPLGELLARYRQERGLSVADVAHATGLPEEMVVLMETTPDVRPDIADVKKIAAVISCPEDELASAIGVEWRLHDNGDSGLRTTAFREPAAAYTPQRGTTPSYSPYQNSMAVPVHTFLPTVMKFRDFWRMLTSVNRDVYGNMIAEIAGFPIDRPLELIMRGSDIDIVGCSAWKLTVKNLSNLCAGELALVRERATGKMAILMLDSSRSALVGRKLFRKSNKAIPLTEKEFDIIVPVFSIEFIPHGRV